MKETVIYLIRHAQSLPSSSVSDKNWPLSETGKNQALELSGILESLNLDIIISSPYLRCIQTIEPYVKNFKKNYEVENDFRERLISKEIIKRFYDVWCKSWDDFDYSLPGCESSRAAQIRFVRAIKKHEQLNRGNTIGISTHGNVTGLFLNWIDGEAGRKEAENFRNPEILKVNVINEIYYWDKNFIPNGIDRIATDYNDTKPA